VLQLVPLDHQAPFISGPGSPSLLPRVPSSPCLSESRASRPKANLFLHKASHQPCGLSLLGLKVLASFPSHSGTLLCGLVMVTEAF
jgi:hypothetical protein